MESISSKFFRKGAVYLRLTEKEMEQRRQSILFKAFHLFSEQGIDSVTLKQVIEAAGVSESTAYRYFKNKETLVKEAFLMMWDTIMSEIKENVERNADYANLSGYKQLWVWIEGFRQLYLEHEDFILFSYEAKIYMLRHKILLDHFQQDILMNAVRGPCLAALEKGKRDGTILSDEDSEGLFFAIWGTVRGYIIKIVLYKRLCGDESPWESRYRIVEKGILRALNPNLK